MKLFSRLCILVLALSLTACGDKAEKARKALAAQNIQVNEENFIDQVTKGNAANVALFYDAGIPAGVVNKAGTPAIVAAMTSNSADTLKLVLDHTPAGQGEHAFVNQQDAAGKNALSMAAERGDDELVKALVAKGAMPFLLDHDQYTPLHFAVMKNHISTAQLLIQLDAAANQDQKPRSINFSNNNAETPLLLAVRGKNPDMVKLLLSQGAQPDIADRRGYTPLMAAVEAGDQQVAGWLLDAKARIDLYDTAGMSPLKFAIQKNDAAMVDLLIKRGADPDFAREGDPLPIELVLMGKPFNMDLFNYMNKISKKTDSVAANLMFGAIDNNQLEVVKILLARGMDPNSKDTDGKTLLYRTLEKGHGDLAAYLIEKGADPQKATGVLPPLELAVRANMQVVVNKLLESGANPDVRTNEGYTLAEVAVYRGYPEVLEMLMSKGAGVKLDYAILWSIIDGKGKAVPVLLKYGANPNVLSQQGDPALWLAVSASEVEAVEALLKYKAFPNVMSQRLGNSALGLAAYIGNMQMIKLLVDAGAQPDLVDKFGVTPLGYAASQARVEAVEYLLSKGADPKHVDKLGRSIMDLANSSQVATDKKEKIAALLRGQVAPKAPAPASSAPATATPAAAAPAVAPTTTPAAAASAPTR